MLTGNEQWDAYILTVLDLTNEHREANGVDPLVLNADLFQTAHDHSIDMAQNDYFSHTNLEGQKPWDRIDETGYNWNTAGENIAAGYFTPEAVVQAWINSPGHNANLLNSSFTEIGISYYYTANDTGNLNYYRYWTQVFANSPDGPNPIDLGGGEPDTPPLPGDLVITHQGTGTDDDITGSDADDVMVGGDGNDRLLGKAGDDVLIGGAGNDKLRGYDGADIFVFDAAGGQDLVVDFSFADGDRIDLRDISEIGSFDDIMDRFWQGTNYAILTTDAGDQLLLANIDIHDLGAEDFIFIPGGSGDDTPPDENDDTTPPEDYEITHQGTNADETIDADDGDNVLHGGDGNDRLLGKAGDDVLIGGAGNDKLRGYDGADIFVFDAAGGQDLVVDFSFADGDRIDLREISEIGSFDDIMDRFWQGTNYAILTTDAGDQLLLAHIDIDDLSAEDFIFIPGGSGDNTPPEENDDTTPPEEYEITHQGTNADETIDADDGDNVLHGGDGNDRLLGRDGDDALIGGAGNDKLRGYDGADIFVFHEAGGQDLVVDFRGAEGDRVDLRDFSEITSFDDIMDRFWQGTNYAIFTADDGSQLLINDGIVQDLEESHFIF